jgi:hypothetical protein
LQAQTFQTPALAAFDIEVGANSCFPELLLAVATVDVACRNGTLATGAGKGVYTTFVACLAPYVVITCSPEETPGSARRKFAALTALQL